MSPGEGVRGKSAREKHCHHAVRRSRRHRWRSNSWMGACAFDYGGTKVARHARAATSFYRRPGHRICDDSPNVMLQEPAAKARATERIINEKQPSPVPDRNTKATRARTLRAHLDRGQCESRTGRRAGCVPIRRPSESHPVGARSVAGCQLLLAQFQLWAAGWLNGQALFYFLTRNIQTS